MRFHVRDRLSRAGKDGFANDDALGQSRSLAFVLDGATGVGDGPLMPSHFGSDAAWLSHGAARYFSQCDADEAPLRNIVRDCASALAGEFAALRQRMPNGGYEMPYASMMLVRPAADHIAYAAFGDCRMLVLHHDGRLSDIGPPPRHREAEAARAKAFDAANKGPMDALPELRRLRNLVNTLDAYWLMAADPAVADHVHSGRVELDGPADVLLMTDGFHALSADYGAYDDAGLVAAAQAQGLGALYRELRAIERADPRGEKFPRFKPSDDATAMLIAAGG